MSKRKDAAPFAPAAEWYAELGVDIESALRRLEGVSVSLQCWQGDDVRGFETLGEELSGGIAVTGDHPGRARNPEELRRDMEKALSLIPGNHRVNLHAMYGEFKGKKTDRDEITSEPFASWADWAEQNGLGLDFNATLFSHEKASSGFTLSHRETAVRDFWIEHVRRCREIGAFFGRKLKKTCVHNLWIPDGSKDETVSRSAYRQRLLQSLDAIYETEFEENFLLDSVECKLFGLGSEAYVVGSHEFYLAWAASRKHLLCMDMGHFHPTESVADKISAVLPFVKGLLLHVSRGVRWDSDHVVILNDDLRHLMAEIVRADGLARTHLAMDFFDASINRVGAWVIGARATLKALLLALLEPVERLREMEANGDGFGRLALLEEMKSLPFGAIWAEFCKRMNVPPDESWIREIHAYERTVLSKRS